jgi:hypothetical protein
MYYEHEWKCVVSFRYITSILKIFFNKYCKAEGIINNWEMYQLFFVNI